MKNLWLLFVVGLSLTVFIDEKRLLVSSQSPTSTTDDLYLEGRTSGDLPIDDEDDDDEDGGSGSGSGDYAFSDILDKEETLRRFLNISKEVLPLQPQPSAASPHLPLTTAAEDSPVQTSSPDGDVVNKDEVPSVGTTSDSWFTESTTPRLRIDISVTEEDDSLDNSLDLWDVPTYREKDDKVIQDFSNEVSAIDRRVNNELLPEEVTSENLWERTDVLAAVIACGVVGFLCAVFLLLLLAYRMKKKDEGSYDLGDTKLSTTAYHKAPTKEFYA